MKKRRGKSPLFTPTHYRLIAACLGDEQNMVHELKVMLQNDDPKFDRDAWIKLIWEARERAGK